MIPIILSVVAAAILLFLIVVAMRPSKFRVVRETKMSASPSTVFAQVNDFGKWRAWSPWEKMDPAMQRTYAGPSAGNGAVYSWIGNKKVGEGRMTIVDSRP